MIMNLAADETVLAIDLGTTNCKVLVLSAELKVVFKQTTEYPVSFLRPGWAEQNPVDWWNAVSAAIQAVTRNHNPTSIKAVGLSGQMHGLVLLNSESKVIRPAILWNDQRSAKQCDYVYSLVGGKKGLVEYTNNPILPGYAGGKILWVRDNEPENYSKIYRFLLPKDYIRYKLTGELATDVSDASGTGLFDVKRRIWSSELIEKLDLPLEWFPDVYESVEIAGEVSQKVSEQTGLIAGTPVIAGGGDAVMQTVGSGAISEDTLLLVIGTGGNVTVSMAEPIQNQEALLQVFCHVIKKRWTAMGVTLSAGNSLKWYRDNFCRVEVQTAQNLDSDPYIILNQEASIPPAGSNNILFLPYLQGERCPYPDPDARGLFIGLSSSTRNADMLRAVMEGVTFSLRHVLDVLKESGINPLQIHSSGGGSKSQIWRQIQADVFNCEVTTLHHSEDASALGAGIIAGVAAGIFSSKDAISNIKIKTRDTPSSENVLIYERLFQIYKQVYPAVQPIYEEMAAK
jgi:xylulokinase